MLAFIDRHTTFIEYLTVWMFFAGIIVLLTAVMVINAEKFTVEDEPGFIPSVAVSIHSAIGALTPLEDRLVNYLGDVARVSIIAGIAGMIAHYFRKKNMNH